MQKLIQRIHVKIIEALIYKVNWIKIYKKKKFEEIINLNNHFPIFFWMASDTLLNRSKNSFQISMKALCCPIEKKNPIKIKKTVSTLLVTG